MAVDRPSLDVPKNRELLEGLLTVPGSMGETYNRFYRYSPRNIGFLALQQCPPEPISTFEGWKRLKRHVTKGSKAFAILRPIQVRVDDDKSDEVKMIRRFKVVRAIFALSQTAGEELPPYEPPEWDTDRALGALAVTRVPFELYDGNTQGYSFEHNVAVSPVAVYPFKTLVHELGHVVGGHTAGQTAEDGREHRGVQEFEAEATAHLTLSELGATDQFNADESRAYIQGWMRNEQPPEKSYGTVLTSTSKILEAGYAPILERTE